MLSSQFQYHTQACQRLIRGAFVPRELPTLIEAILSSQDEGYMVRSFCRDDAQIFIDVIDEVRSTLPLHPKIPKLSPTPALSNQALDRPDLSPRTRKKCLKSLYRICSHHTLLPRALKIPVCYDRTGVALYKGGFADVWKGEHDGRGVAVKVLRMYSNSDLQKILGVRCRPRSRYP